MREETIVGRPIMELLAAGGSYNTLGQIHTVTDPNSGVTTYNYDSLNRLSSVVNANNVKPPPTTALTFAPFCTSC
jgi:YD repeat-containing protein